MSPTARPFAQPERRARTIVEMPRPTPSELKAYIRADYDAAAHGAIFRRPGGATRRRPLGRRTDRCLDVACGSGLVARAFAARVGARRVSACDLSAAQMAEARAILRAAGMAEIDVRVLDAERLDYAEGSFERAGCSFGLNHFPRPLVALRGVRRVLSPGGLAGFTIWDRFTPTIRVRFDDLLLDLVPAIRTWVSSPCEVAFGRLADRRDRPEHIADLMRRAGFAEIKHRTHSSPPTTSTPRPS